MVKRAPPSRDELFEILETVMDPEVPVLSIVDLGIVRDAEPVDEGAVITITPTYSGCPAMREIEHEIRAALEGRGIADVEIRTTYSPAWTTDWMTDAGKRKLTAYGIAPPTGRAAAGHIRLALAVKCPRCGSLDNREVARFGSTACKALYECRACLEPFDHFKVH